MSECFKKIFLLDGHSMPCEKFPNQLVFSGQSLFEVIRFQNGIPIFIEDHIKRLEHTALISKIKITISLNEFIQQMNMLMKLNQQKNGNIKIVFNVPVKSPTVHKLIYFIEHHYPTEDQYRDGVPVILYKAERVLPTAKILNMELRASIFKKLIYAMAYEALLVDKKGFIREGSHSNIFFIMNNGIYTAPDEEVLPGIARTHILRICNDLNIPVTYKKIHMNQLNRIQDAFISGTSPGVLRISSINGNQIKKEHFITTKISKTYFKLIETYVQQRVKNT